MRLARWTFLLAGIYGLLALVPHCFLLDRIARETPSAVTYVEFSTDVASRSRGRSCSS